MDFLEKLNYLMDKNNLNKNTLSKACDIPYTTIDGWYKKGYEGLKLTTLRKLASYFETSLDFWANDNNPFHDSSSTHPLMEIYERLNEEGQSKLMDYAEDLDASGRYKKNNQSDMGSCG